MVDLILFVYLFVYYIIHNKFGVIHYLFISTHSKKSLQDPEEEIMKTKTSFKHMYLVDNNLYNKLSLNSNLNIDKQTLSHPQNIAIKPNIHIHNKHAPSSSSLSHLTYADTPPHPPPQRKNA